MKIAALLEELDMTIDDVRWYLALRETARLLALKDTPREVTRLLWSGRLERDLYDMEERWLKEMEQAMRRGRRDEAAVRSVLHEVAEARSERYAEVHTGP
jgi:DNA-binding transcriptional MerR regulator